VALTWIRAVAKGAPIFPLSSSNAWHYLGALNRLRRDEQALYEALRDDVHGERIRMAQERIGFGAVLTALHPCTPAPLLPHIPTSLKTYNPTSRAPRR